MLTGFDLGGAPSAPPPPSRARAAAPPRRAEPLSLDDVLAGRRRGRGALSNPAGRYEAESRVPEPGEATQNI